MLYLIIIILVITVLFFVSIIVIKDNNIKNKNKDNKNNKINNNNALEILTIISVRNYDEKLIDYIYESSISGIIINIDNLNIDFLSDLIKKIEAKIKRKILIGLDQDYKATYSIFYDKNFKVYSSYIGERNSKEYAYKIAYERALKLKSAGINMILSPICNTYCNEKSHLKEHIFSNDEDIASELIYHTIKAYKDAGMIIALKYFPKYYDDELYINDKIKNNKKIIIDTKKTFLSGIKAKANIIVLSHSNNGDLYKSIIEDELKFKGIIMTDYINSDDLFDIGFINYGINIITDNYYNKIKNLKNTKMDLKTCQKVQNLIKKIQH